MTIQTDCVIVGAGPCGLFQVFELGLLDIRAHVVDALPRAGGQCTELYPEKPIYDIPAYPIIGAQELVDKLMEQIKPFSPSFHFDAPVTEVQVLDADRFRLRTGDGTEFETRSVVVAGGVGAFAPVLLKLEGLDRFNDSQVFYKVTDASRHHGKHLIVLGGGDSALDWALAMAEKAASVTLIHRSDKFRAHNASVNKLRALEGEGKLKILAGHVLGYTEEGGALTGLRLKTTAGTELNVPAEQLLVFFGLSPKLGPIAEWGLNLNKNQINVDTEKFETSVPGIYAVGDINFYPGKKKLILSGFHEAALAAFAIKHRLSPNEKIHLQYTTTSPAVHKKLGVETPRD